jgi:serine/threonine protein kinase
MALPAGTRLGSYEIEEMLDAGGMSEVYKARDTRLDRTVAIKVLFPDVSADPNRRAFPCASAAMRSKSGDRGRVARSFAGPRSFVDQGRSGSRNDSCGSGEQTMLGALTLLVQHDSCHVGPLAFLRKYSRLSAMRYT